MLISSVLLTNAYQYKKQRENYSRAQSTGAGMSAGFIAFYMLIATVFFLMELSATILLITTKKLIL